MRVATQHTVSAGQSATPSPQTWRQTRHVPFVDSKRTAKALRALRSEFPGFTIDVRSKRLPGGVVEMTVNARGPVAALRKAELIIAHRGLHRRGERAVPDALSTVRVPSLVPPPNGGAAAPSPQPRGVLSTKSATDAAAPRRHVYWIGGGGDKESMLGYGPHYMTRRAKQTWEHATPGDDSYWSHRETDALVADILKRHASGTTEISLVGHSLGAAAAMRVTRRLEKHGIDVDQLVTLDPVSMTLFRRPNNQRQWINVYQKQSVLDRIADVPILGTLVAAVIGGLGMLFGKVSGADYIATLGNQLGHERGADENIEFEYNHGAVPMMYRAAHNAMKR